MSTLHQNFIPESAKGQNLVLYDFVPWSKAVMQWYSTLGKLSLQSSCRTQSCIWYCGKHAVKGREQKQILQIFTCNFKAITCEIMFLFAKCWQFAFRQRERFE